MANLLAEGQNSVGGQLGEPDCLGLLVCRDTLARVTHKVRCVQTIRINLVLVHQKLPGPFNGLLLKRDEEKKGDNTKNDLEVVAKRPVAQHLEESMMINILTNIVCKIHKNL
jgi:hypothetical protein